MNLKFEIMHNKKNIVKKLNTNLKYEYKINNKVQ